MFLATVRDCDGTRRGLLFVNDTHVDYTVEDVTLDDAGQYSCFIHISAFYNDTNAALYVFAMPDKPLVSPSVPNHEASRFTMQCQAESTSLPSADHSHVNMVYTWRNNSKELDPDDLPERYSITSSRYPANAVNDLLAIADLSRHDAGSHTCYGHENGSTLRSVNSNSYNLQPLYVPGDALPGGDQAVVAGDDVTLSCTADDRGRPDGSWIWTTPSGAVVNTKGVGQLTIAIVNVMNDGGEYSCHLKNHVGDGAPGSITITVQYGPSVLSFEAVAPSGPINQHDDVTFSCQTDSQPVPVISLIGPNGDTLVSSSTSNTLEHTLTDIDCLDSGYYKCIAFNTFTGKQRSNLLLVTVQCPPRKHLTSDTRVAAAEGDSVTFSISVVAFPEPTFTWNKPYEGHFTETRSTIWCSLHVCMSSSIIIPHITKSDFGNYSVTASSGLGVIEDVAFSLVAAVSITIQWTSGWNRGGEQVFILMYRRADSDDSYTNITDISDPGQGETVSSKAVGLLPDTSYDFIVLATNQFGACRALS